MQYIPILKYNYTKDALWYPTYLTTDLYANQDRGHHYSNNLLTYTSKAQQLNHLHSYIKQYDWLRTLIKSIKPINHV